MPNDNVHTFLTHYAALWLHYSIFLGVVAKHLKCDIKLVRVVDGDDSLVCGLVLVVKVQLYWEDEHGDFPIKNTR